MKQWKHGFALAAAVLSPCCATSRPSVTGFAPIVAPGSAYFVSGLTTEGMQTAELVFSRDGTVMMAGDFGCGGTPTGETAIIDGRRYGQRVLPSNTIRLEGETLYIACNDVRMTIERGNAGLLHGTLSLLEYEKETRDGPCQDWDIDSRTGRRLSCIRWELIEVVVRTVWSAEVPLNISGRGNRGTSIQAPFTGG